MRIIVKVRSQWIAKCVSSAASWHLSVRHFAFAAAGLALSAASTADVAPAPKMHGPDPRVAHLERFFEHYNCPVPYHISGYLRAADTYELDYRLLPAIAIRETLCGVSDQRNNHWGYHPGRQSFESVESGIDFVAERLANGFFYRGKTLQEKLFIYNPRSAYPGEIQRIMRQIE